MAEHAAPTTLETTVNNLTNICENGALAAYASCM